MKGLRPLACGVVPTPALALYGLNIGAASLMVTGSHIPADRNGIKFCRPDGDIGKQDEMQVLNENPRLDAGGRRAAREAVEKGSSDLDFTRLDAEAFMLCPDISLDYAIMEKTSNAAVVPSSFTWSDLGSWDAVWKLGERDDNGNVRSGNATLINTKNSLVMSRTSHLAVQGAGGCCCHCQ